MMPSISKPQCIYQLHFADLACSHLLETLVNLPVFDCCVVITAPILLKAASTFAILCSVRRHDKFI